jgi:hypothetical protein
MRGISMESNNIIPLASRKQAGIPAACMGVGRRALMKACAPLLALGALPSWRVAAESNDAARMLQIVGEILIPATDTAGAGAAEVAAFATLAVGHGVRGAPPDLLDRLLAELDRQIGAAFLLAPFAAQKSTLEALDAATYAPGAPGGSAWPLAKTLILIGYYTSEVGGSQELEYDLVPGRFDADIPVGKDTRALSNDWSGVVIRKAGPN